MAIDAQALAQAIQAALGFDPKTVDADYVVNTATERAINVELGVESVVTVTLPQAGVNDGNLVIVRRKHPGPSVIVAAADGDTINGVESNLLDSDGDYVALVSDGHYNWQKVSFNEDVVPEPTPTPPSLHEIAAIDTRVVIHSGANFYNKFLARTVLDEVIPLTGATAVGYVRKTFDGDVVAIFNCSVNEADGEVEVSLSPSQTFAFQGESFAVFDVFVVDGDNRYLIARGTVAPVSSSTHTTPPPPPSDKALYEVVQTDIPAGAFDVTVEFTVQKIGEYWVEILNVEALTEQAEPIGALGTKDRTLDGLKVLLTGPPSANNTHRVTVGVRVK